MSRYQRSKKVILLFNPYHDTLGRFAQRRGGAAPKNVSGMQARGYKQARIGDTSVTLVDGKLKDKELVKMAQEYHAVTKALADNFPGVKPKDIYVTEAPAKYNFSAMYDYGSDTVFVTPEIGRELAKGNPEARMVMFHELGHSRGYPGRFDYKKHTEDARQREEGLNSLMAHRAYVKSYGKHPPYYAQSVYEDMMMTTASHYMRQAGGDTKKAWAMIDKAHGQGTSNPVSYAQMKKSADLQSYSDLLGDA